MKFAAYVLALLVGGCAACATETRSVEVHAVEIPVPIKHEDVEFDLLVDETLPAAAMDRAIDDWEMALDDAAISTGRANQVIFSSKTIRHDEAMHNVRRKSAHEEPATDDGTTYRETVVVVNLDLEPGFQPCPDDALACYQSPGQIYLYEVPLMFWPSIPAHELGHAMGLDHEAVGSIMAKYVEGQPNAPTHEDGALLLLTLRIVH